MNYTTELSTLRTSAINQMVGLVRPYGSDMCEMVNPDEYDEELTDEFHQQTVKLSSEGDTYGIIGAKFIPAGGAFIPEDTVVFVGLNVENPDEQLEFGLGELNTDKIAELADALISIEK